MYFVWNLVNVKEFCSSKKPFYNIARKKKVTTPTTWWNLEFVVAKKIGIVAKKQAVKYRTHFCKLFDYFFHFSDVVGTGTLNFLKAELARCSKEKPVEAVI